MAIDTAAKRRSAAAIKPIHKGGIIPDGTIDASDRATIAWLYSGISIVSAIIALTFTDTLDIADSIYGIIRIRTRLRQVISRMDIQRMNVSRLPLVRYILRRFP